MGDGSVQSREYVRGEMCKFARHVVSSLSGMVCIALFLMANVRCLIFWIYLFVFLSWPFFSGKSLDLLMCLL